MAMTREEGRDFIERVDVMDLEDVSYEQWKIYQYIKADRCICGRDSLVELVDANQN